MVKLGDAGEIDELILRYRELACDANLPSLGARPNASSQQSKPVAEVEDLSIDLQLSQRLLTPILESISLVFSLGRGCANGSAQATNPQSNFHP